MLALVSGVWCLAAGDRQGFVDETLPLRLKSERAPDLSALAGRRLRGAAGSVTRLVTSTFMDVVMDPTKDVAVLFYSPLCPASRAVEPVYDKVAKEIAASEPGLVLAKLDLEHNDIPARRLVMVRHYPCLWFFPKGEKGRPVNYR